MRLRRRALIAPALALAICGVAVAAVKPKAHIAYSDVHHSKPVFAINLATKSTTRISASKPRPMTFPSSSLLVLCPTATGAPATELQMGFPGATLKLHKGHYRFMVSFSEPKADLVTFGKTITIAHEHAHATVTGTVESAKLIAGTISVTATGCNLKKSKYKAKPFKAG
jgi:hypothetical protein